MAALAKSWRRKSTQWLFGVYETLARTFASGTAALSCCSHFQPGFLALVRHYQLDVGVGLSLVGVILFGGA
jgi:hypothetical protein